MANCLFGWPNYGDVSVSFTPTLSGGSWASTLPLTNLQDRRLAKAARTTTASLASTRFAFDLKTSRTVGIFAIPKHTMSQSAKVRILAQTSTLLIDYEAGDDIVAAGGTFARSGNGTYKDSSGVVQTAATGVPRDSHFATIGGRRSILLEGSRQNICLQSEVLGTTWTVAAATIGSNVTTAPDGGTTADKLQEDNTNAQHVVTQAITCGNAQYTYSIWTKAAERTKCVVSISDNATGAAEIGVDLSNGTLFATGAGVGSWTGISSRIEAYANGWYRVSVTGTRGAGTQCLVRVFTWTTSAVFVGTTGSGVYAWGGQLEAAGFSSSYIQTTTIAVTRNADTLSFPYTSIPQVMTVYSKMTSNQASNFDGSFIWEIGTAAGTRLSAHKTSGAATITGTHRSAAGTVTSTSAATVVIGDTLETRTVLNTDGSIIQADSVNSAAETVGSTSAANALDGAWAATTIYLNADASAANIGFACFESLRIMAGVQTLTSMQSSVYDSGWLNAWPKALTAEELVNFNVAFTHIPTSPITFRFGSVQISDAANTAGFIDLSRLIIAGVYQPTLNPAPGAKFGWEDDTERKVSDGGAAIYNEKPMRRYTTFVLDTFPQTEALGSTLDMIRRSGKSKQIMFVWDPSDTTVNAHLLNYLAVFRELSPLEFPTASRNTLPVSMVEEL